VSGWEPPAFNDAPWLGGEVCFGVGGGTPEVRGRTGPGGSAGARAAANAAGETHGDGGVQKRQEAGAPAGRRGRGGTAHGPLPHWAGPPRPRAGGGWERGAGTSGGLLRRRWVLNRGEPPGTGQ